MNDLKTIVLEYLKEYLRSDDRTKEYKIFVGFNSYTILDIISEIENDTGFGISFVNDMLKLTIDLVLRGKEKI